MATNVFFNNFEAFGEQRLYEDLIVESIKIHGQDMYYIPYTKVAPDPVLGEDSLKQFNKSYLLEFYIRSVDGFEGDGSFVSKFGLEIRDQVTFTVAKKRFLEEIGEYEDLPRPREGDLIYFPLNKKLFQISYVDNKPFFYPFGELFTFDIYCENFEYSSEEFNTGIPEVDAIQYVSQDQYDLAIKDTDGNAILDASGAPILPGDVGEYVDVIDPIQDNEDLESEGLDIIDFSVADPFSEGGTY